MDRLVFAAVAYKTIWWEKWQKQQSSNIMINSTPCRAVQSTLIALIVCRCVCGVQERRFRMLSSALLLLITSNERIYKFSHTRRQIAGWIFERNQKPIWDTMRTILLFQPFYGRCRWLTCLAFVRPAKLYKLNEPMLAWWPAVQCTMFNVKCTLHSCMMFPSLYGCCDIGRLHSTKLFDSYNADSVRYAMRM